MANEQDEPLNYRELRLTRVSREKRPRKDVIRTIPKTPHLTCAASTPPKSLAKTIYLCLMEHTYCEVSALHEEANYKALKAIALASGMAGSAGVRMQTEIGFIDPRPLDSVTGQRATGFVYIIHTNLIKDHDGKIVRT